MMKRPNKIEYYLNIAKEVSQRSTCLRRKFGVVIVKEDQIISTGYVGAPRGAPNCIDLKICLRDKFNIPPGERYELCRSVHAEMNAIINAARAGVSLLGGTLYLYGENVKNKETVGKKPCKLCRRMIINAGLKEVIVRTKDGYDVYEVKAWIQEDFKKEQCGELYGY